MLHPPERCRYCAAPLAALQAMRGDVCTAAACRRRDGDDRLAALRGAALQELRGAALADGADPRLLAAPVFWLRDHDTTAEPVTAAERTAHLAHLEAALAEATAIAEAAAVAEAASAVAPATAPAGGMPPPQRDDGLVCGHCRGRCCREGRGERHGFIDAALLQRRQQRHGGTLADAAAHYAERLPTLHAIDSCLYHGTSGCTLERTDRSDICNGYTCQSLRDARGPLAAAPETGVVLASERRGRLVGAAWLHGPRPLRLEAIAPARPGAEA